MRYLYPEGKIKALTLSYDDAQNYDRKLVEIMDKYGIRGTFHLNSGTLADSMDDLFISKAEVKELYKNHEVACHGVEHRNLLLLSRQKMLQELGEDRRELERITGKLVQGMSYAYGSYSDEAEDVAKTVGIKYSRTVNSTNGFVVPSNFLEWHPTCHHSGGILQLGERFLHTFDWEELPLMYVWGHSFEFGREGNWDLIEDFCRLMSGKEDIWYATNLEICNYITAIRNLEYSADGKTVYNPTAVTVWMKDGDRILTVGSGETLQL